MGLRCSLFGHRYGEHEVEREREERGNEVVVITKEYKVCTVCGERILVSENKEVRSQATGDSDTPDTPETTTVASASGSMADNQPPDSGGGIILEDDEEEGPPEWPDPTPATEESTTESTASTSWPEPSGTDEGFEASGPADASSPDVEYQGLNPSAQDSSTVDADPTGVSTSGDGGEILDPAETSDSTPNVDDPPRPTEHMTLVCPECGFVDDAGQGSLRRGDICPECLDGYLRATEERNK